MKMPKDLKNSIVYKKDLNDKDKANYEHLLNRWSAYLDTYINGNTKYKEEYARAVSVIISNYTYYSDSNISCGCLSIQANSSGTRSYRELAKDTLLEPANKLVFLSRIINGYHNIWWALDPTPIVFENEKYHEYLCMLSPIYGIRQAVKEDKLDLELLLKMADIAPKAVYDYKSIARLKKVATTEELISIVEHNPAQASIILDRFPEEILELLEEDTILKLVSFNSSILSSIPENKITDEIADAALEKSGKSIVRLPEEFRTPERIEKAVMKAPSVLGDLPPKYHKPHLLMKAVLTSNNAKKYFKRGKR
jgi:hypothetical protein